jgi:glyoxylase-like metal-dependent hydrolase (beta-lactamase superfamily II)
MTTAQTTGASPVASPELPDPDTIPAVAEPDETLTILGRRARYSPGLRDLGAGVHAWLQPNGELGESNAGLLVGDGQSLLIDTLWDLRLTRRMLDAMRAHTADAPVRRLVNTHGDPDHCWGNQLLSGAQIIASRAGAEDMVGDDPARLRLLSRAGRPLGRLPSRGLPLPGASLLAGLGTYGQMLAAYDFRGITLTPPTLTFDRELELDIGGRRAELIEVGPAHTPGDVIVHIPHARTVFAADLMFVDVTPIMWVGPVENWLAGLAQIEALEPTTVVPGHGPVTDLDGVRAMRAYWEFIAPSVRERVGAGMDSAAAARDILRSPEFASQPFAGWDAPERLAVNAEIIARNSRGLGGRVSDFVRLRLIARMGELASEFRR